MKGFKSFANETSLHFGEDVIGVVGPNGSGKSNVVDAIRWVLGEQKSSELRLEKMTDVIFNGTRKKKEAPTAQVTLTFDNNKGILPSEYSTVAITRMVYRNGDSEYRLNDVKCRLKDITTLLMDTGMGSNSYAIIALGMVDDILADKNHARRHMFEQAAGISKYKKRKRETENKLRATSDDLDRIEDLIFEIEGNLKSLERQAKRAQKYLDIKEQYKEVSILHATVSIAELKVAYKDLSDALEQQKDAYRELDVTLRQKEADLERIKKEHVEQEMTVSKNQKELNELTSDLRDAEAEKGLLEQKSSFKEENIQRLKHSLAQNEQRIKDFTDAKDNLAARLEREKEELQTLSAQWKEAEAAYTQVKNRHAEVKSTSDDRMQSALEVKNKVYELEKELAIIDNTMENVRQDIARDQLQLSHREEEHSALVKVEAEHAASLEMAEKELEFRRTKEEEKQTQIAELVEQQEGLKDELSEVHRQLDKKKNEFDLMKSMVDNLEGYPKTIKFLNKEWKNKTQILSDIIDVEDDYKSVIEQYLENYLNYYVVDDIKQADEAIKLLSHNQIGKAKFFLLNDIPKYELKLPPSVDAKPARYVVTSDDKYSKLLDYLFHNVMIVDDFIAKVGQLEKEGYVYLSEHGDYIKTALTISGGSVGLFQGKKIGRKKALEKLEKEIKSLSSNRDKLEKDLNQVKFKLDSIKNTNYKTEISQLEHKINALRQDAMKAALKIEQFLNLKREIEEKKASVDQRIKDADIRKKEIITAQEQLQNQLNSHQEESDKIETNLEALNTELSQQSEQYNQLHINYIRKENMVENLTKDLELKDRDIADVKEHLRKNEIRIKDDEKAIVDIRKEIETLSESLVAKYDKKKELSEKLSSVEKSYYEARNHIREEEDAVRVLNRQQNQIQLKVQQLRDEHSDVKFKISAVGERLKIEFNLSINDFINDEVETDRTIDDIEEELERLRNKLSRFGEINPMAVESYNEMKERYDHIVVQRDDILEAKESLIKTIEEIETSATDMYMDSFHQVRDNFIRVFRSLFSEEDDCDLVLVDAENPLESDIDIIAKPKGKKPKSLSQLSGGEKTLTATALLFSLYLLKPAPFCIFDEVDAPLDDANIAKFNKIIKKFSEESQFIIVTHNKATMSAVDILYGVYMQEQGISAVTPVDFRNLEHQEYLETVA